MGVVHIGFVSPENIIHKHAEDISGTEPQNRETEKGFRAGADEALRGSGYGDRGLKVRLEESEIWPIRST